MKRQAFSTGSTVFAAVALLSLLASSCGDPAPATRGRSTHHLTDSDGDGVADRVDRCPGTPAIAEVNAFGCMDSDHDGVPDGDDECPQTERNVRVDEFGCEVPSGGCPGSEVYQPRLASFAARARLLDRFGRPVAQTCADDTTPPPSPRILEPSVWAVEYQRVFSTNEEVLIRAEAVSDPCGPVTYRFEVDCWDYLYWHRWIPVLRRQGLTQPETRLTLPWNGWCRYRVFAADQNANASFARAWRYLVFAGPDAPTEDQLTPPAKW